MRLWTYGAKRHDCQRKKYCWAQKRDPRPPSLVEAKDHVIPAQCEGIVMAIMQNPLRVENNLVETRPQAHPPEETYIARTLIQDHQEVPVRILNDTHRDQMLTRGSPLAHCEPLTLVTRPEVAQPRVQDLSPKLDDVITVARPHLTNEEFQELEKLVTE
jgi:hypothetical protein